MSHAQDPAFTLTRSFAAGALIGFLAAAGLAQQSGPSGTYFFVSDSDSTVPSKGSTVTLTFTPVTGSLAFNAVRPGETSTDNGTYRTAGTLISLSLPRLGISVNSQPYILTGTTLVLPFKLFSEGPGTSTWTGGAGSKGGAGGKDAGGDTGGGKAGDGGKGGNKTGGSSAGRGDSGGGKTGGQGAQGRSGGQGDSGSRGSQGGSGAAGSQGKAGSMGSGAQSQVATYAGNYQGRGAGEEVRFRDPNSLLILTVKHSTEFFFNIDAKGEITGEGTVTYDLTRNTEGLDNLAAGVRGLMGMMPMPGPPGAGAMSGAAGKMGETATSGVPGVTSLQYDATHLKNGAELRHFKFRGHVEKVTLMDGGGEQARIYLESEGDFTLPGGGANNELIAAWEVNKVKEQKAFPCWSPFLKGFGTFRKGPGGVWVAEFQEKGTHRNGVKPWQEYGYYWMARQIK